MLTRHMDFVPCILVGRRQFVSVSKKKNQNQSLMFNGNNVMEREELGLCTKTPCWSSIYGSLLTSYLTSLRLGFLCTLGSLETVN